MDISIIGFETWLESATNYEKQKKTGTFSLDTIKFLTEKLQNPQNCYKSIHVAGSKGKGSVSTMCSAILRQAGFDCGLYTSPHILHFLERVTNAGENFSHSIYEKSASEIIKFIEENTENLDKLGLNQASWFELLTLFAFLCFKNQNCQWAVFETGLGGRFDATNVLLPRVSVLTPIELEHTEYLGNTIKQIAGEKAGIIKKNVPVCVAFQSEEAENVFLQSAKLNNSPIYLLKNAVKNIKQEYKNGKNAIEIDFGNFTFENCTKPAFNKKICANLQLFGEIQAQNAALASLAVKCAMPEIEESTIEKGLENAFLSGRFEILDILYKNSYNLKIILDGAHTVNSVSLCLKTFSDIFKNKNYNLLFACASDKDVENIAPLFFIENNKPQKISLTKPGDIKKSDLNRIQNAFSPLCKKHSLNYTLNEDFESVIENAIIDAGENDNVLLVTGSFYLVAEVKKFLKHKSAVFTIKN